MHCIVGIGKFEVKVFIDVAGRVGQVMRKVVLVHHVIVVEHSSVQVLRLEVKTHVVEVSRIDLIIGRGRVCIILR